MLVLINRIKAHDLKYLTLSTLPGFDHYLRQNSDTWANYIQIQSHWPKFCSTDTVISIRCGKHNIFVCRNPDQTR